MTTFWPAVYDAPQCQKRRSVVSTASPFIPILRRAWHAGRMPHAGATRRSALRSAQQQACGQARVVALVLSPRCNKFNYGNRFHGPREEKAESLNARLRGTCAERFGFFSFRVLWGPTTALCWRLYNIMARS